MLFILNICLEFCEDHQMIVSFCIRTWCRMLWRKHDAECCEESKMYQSLYYFMEWISFLCTRISSIVVTICCTAAAFNKFLFFQFYPQIWKICSSLFLLSNLSHDCLEKLLIKGCLLPVICLVLPILWVFVFYEFGKTSGKGLYKLPRF